MYLAILLTEVAFISFLRHPDVMQKSPPFRKGTKAKTRERPGLRLDSSTEFSGQAPSQSASPAMVRVTVSTFLSWQRYFVVGRTMSSSGLALTS